MSSWLNNKCLLISGLNVAVVAVGIALYLGYYRHKHNVMEIVEHPHPTLREISEPLYRIDEQVISLSNDMVATMRYRAMIDFFVDRSLPRGLAAPQVGIAKRLVVCGLNGEIKVMLNPEILERRGTFSAYDDCMSVRKGDKKEISRSEYLKIRYKSLANREITLTARNHDAAMLEHEIDHLNGVLNIDYWDGGKTLSSNAD